MTQYLELLKEILNKGTLKPAAREGMPSTLSLFGYQNRYNLQDGFPLVTTKKISFKNIVVELLFFLKGDSNIKYLVDNGCNIWLEDGYNFYKKLCKRDNILPVNYEQWSSSLKSGMKWKDNLPNNYQLGDLGEQYPKLWRDWNGNNSNGEVCIDQIEELIEGLKSNPTSRRHIITAWNPVTLDDMALNACHTMVQFNCRLIPHRERQDLYLIPSHSGVYATDEEMDEDDVPKYYFDCQMYQRSADSFLGVPYNIASYALLTNIISNIVGMVPGEFIHTFGDAHIYQDHMDQVKEQITREPKKLPDLQMSDRFWYSLDAYKSDYIDLNKFIEELVPQDFIVEGYDPHPSIKGKLSTGLN